MNKPTIEEILTPKPEARPRIYAYAIADAAHTAQLKVGQTTRDVKQRVAEQLGTANIKNFRERVERDVRELAPDVFKVGMIRDSKARALGVGSDGFILQTKFKSISEKHAILTRKKYFLIFLSLLYFKF